MNDSWRRAVWAIAEGLALIALAITCNKEGKDALNVWGSASELMTKAKKEGEDVGA